MTDMASAAPEPGTAAATDQAASPLARQWLAPAWFLLGVLVGILGLAAYTRLTAQPTPTVVAMREAARDGTLDAIATLQAGSSPAESRATSTPVVVETAPAANQIGNTAAQVTIVEFSDFQ